MRRRNPDRDRPEFRYAHDGDWVGEHCPRCDCEVRIRRRGQKRSYLWCSCGWCEHTADYVPAMRWMEREWDPGRHEWPEDYPDDSAGERAADGFGPR